MSLKRFYSEHDAFDIAELQASDRLKNDDYFKKIENSLMTNEQRNALIIKQFKGM